MDEYGSDSKEDSEVGDILKYNIYGCIYTAFSICMHTYLSNKQMHSSLFMMSLLGLDHMYNVTQFPSIVLQGYPAENW